MLKIQYRNVKDLKKLPNNPRIIKDRQFETLCKSIKENPLYFEARPVLLSDRTGELIIIAGNQRYEAAKQIGLPRVPTILFSKISEEKEREIIIRDNVQNGDWDMEILANEWNLEELADWGVKVDQFLPADDDDMKDISDKVSSQYRIEVICKSEKEQETTYNKLIEEGYECRILTL